MAVISPAYSEKSSSKTIDSGFFQYSVLHLVIRGRNADEILEGICKDTESGKSVHELELIFAPLMESRLPTKVLLLKAIRLEKRFIGIISKINGCMTIYY